MGITHKFAEWPPWGGYLHVDSGKNTINDTRGGIKRSTTGHVDGCRNHVRGTILWIEFCRLSRENGRADGFVW